MKRQFRFTEKSLKYFDSIFPFEGQLETGLWVYENPFVKQINETSNKTTNFFVQVGGGGVLWIDGWSPDEMNLTQIINKLKNS